MKHSAVIIEDEKNSRDLLSLLLRDYCPTLELVGTAAGVQDGIKLIENLRPEIVFLDIEMKGGTGFDILEAVSALSFALIFVTGYDNYAIKAFRFAAVDYLMKPVSIEELKNTVDRITTSTDYIQNRLGFVKQLMDNEAPNKLIIRSLEKSHLILFDALVYLTSDGNYTKFYLNDDAPKLSSYPIKYYEDLLPDHLFYRIHKSHIINLEYVLNFDGGRGGFAHLKTDVKLPIAARRKSDFKRSIKRFLAS